MAEKTPENFLVSSFSPNGSGRFFADVTTEDGSKYVYVPQEFVYKGARIGDTQYFDKSFLNKDYLDVMKPIAVSDDLLYDSIKKAGYIQPGVGVLIKQDDFLKYDSAPNNVTTYNAVGKFAGPVQGIGEKDGKLVYSFAGSEGSTYGVIGEDGVPFETTVTVTQPKKRGGVLGSIARTVTNAIASVPFLPEVVGIATGNPYLYGSLKSAQTAGSGGSLSDTIKSGVISGASMAAMQYALGPTDVSAGQPVGGTPGVSEVYPVDMSVGGTVTPLPPVDMTLPSYGLLDGVTFPGQGLQVPPSNVSTLPSSLADGVGLPGLQAPTMPTIPGMGGAGLTIPVEGGTVGAGGFTPEGAVPVLGDPSSFINDPNVLGRPVIETASSTISLQDAFRAARTANSLLGGGEQPQQQYPAQQLPGMQAGAVDLLSLPQLRATRAEIAGLLAPRAYRGPVFDIYSGLPTSLLG